MTPQISSFLQDIQARVVAFLEAGDHAGIRHFLHDHHPADIADLLEVLDEKYRLIVFNLLHDEAAAEVLDEANTQITRDLVDAVPDEKIADLLESMPVDDAAEILSEITPARAGDLLELMEPAEAAEVGALLAYPENCAGRMMVGQVARVDSRLTAQQAIDYLRQIDPETETLAYLYVVDSANRLLGVVALRKLLTAPPERLVGDLMETPVISIRDTADQEEAAQMVARYDFLAIPVVDQADHLLGVITHDDVIDILTDSFTEDAQRIGGSQPLENEYLSTPVLTVVQKRIGWLLILFLTEMLTGTVIRSFETEIQSVVALSFFIPLLIGTGGNAGSQTTSTIIRALAVGEARFTDTWKLLWHELQTGLLLGVAMGVVGFVRALMWKTTIPIALTVGLSLLAIVIWSNIIGAVLPPLADRLKIDPTVISGPVMSTLVDATGLLIYFTLAGWIIGL